MVDLNLGNVDERPEKHKDPSVQIPGSCRGGRRVTRCLATLAQGWTELCQGKKILPSVLLTTNPNPGEEKIPLFPARERCTTAPSDSRRVTGGIKNTLKVQQCKAEGFPFCFSLSK